MRDQKFAKIQKVNVAHAHYITNNFNHNRTVYSLKIFFLTLGHHSLKNVQFFFKSQNSSGYQSRDNLVTI